MYVSIWLNTIKAVQMFLTERRIFVFFFTLFLKKMGIILSASKPPTVILDSVNRF